MVLVFAETPGGHIKKAAHEAVTYGAKAAQALGTECVALTLGSHIADAGSLGANGAKKVLNVADASLNQMDSAVYANVIAQVAKQLGAQLVILSHTSTGKAVAGRLAVRLDAGIVSGVNALPQTSGGFHVQKSVYSGKAIATYQISSGVKVVTLMGNAIKPETLGSAVAVEAANVTVPASSILVKELITQQGTVPLPEAEVVVSAGRGMKDPSNWGIVEELATVLGATTACSRPVSDTGWRPHHEHVGQTGIAIRPNLYIAIGISGAIQHLAGVNNSKVIVVINKDPEAPFFKAADYGIVGDLFEVVPKLTAAIKKLKG